jgi:hypothetical protein
VVDRLTCLGNGDRLVQPLAARKHISSAAVFGFPNLHDVIQLIHIVDVTGTEIHDLQSSHLFSLFYHYITKTIKNKEPLSV